MQSSRLENMPLALAGCTIEGMPPDSSSAWRCNARGAGRPAASAACVSCSASAGVSSWCPASSIVRNTAEPRPAASWLCNRAAQQPCSADTSSDLSSSAISSSSAPPDRCSARVLPSPAACPALLSPAAASRWLDEDPSDASVLGDASTVSSCNSSPASQPFCVAPAAGRLSRCGALSTPGPWVPPPASAGCCGSNGSPRAKSSSSPESQPSAAPSQPGPPASASSSGCSWGTPRAPGSRASSCQPLGSEVDGCAGVTPSSPPSEAGTALLVTGSVREVAPATC